MTCRLTLDLDIENARKIIRDFDAALEPVRIEQLHGGGTDVYRIDLTGGADPLILKIYGDNPEGAPAKEAAVARLLAGKLGTAVPRWLRVDERRIHLPLRFALMTMLPGEPLRHFIPAADTETTYRRAGALLRSLHEIPLDAYGDLTTDGVVDPQSTNDAYMRAAFAALFRQFRDLRAETALAGRLETAAWSRFDLFADCLRPVLCHNDFQPGNVLAGRSGDGVLRVTGLIDFAEACAADPLLDLAKALFCSAHEDPRAYEPLLDGYGPIDRPDPAETLWLYTLFHRVTMWCWLIRLGEDPASDGPRSLLRDLDAMSP